MITDHKGMAYTFRHCDEGISCNPNKGGSITRKIKQLYKFMLCYQFDIVTKGDYLKKNETIHQILHSSEFIKSIFLVMLTTHPTPPSIITKLKTGTK